MEQHLNMLRMNFEALDAQVKRLAAKELTQAEQNKLVEVTVIRDSIKAELEKLL